MVSLDHLCESSQSNWLQRVTAVKFGIIECFSPCSRYRYCIRRASAGNTARNSLSPDLHVRRAPPPPSVATLGALHLLGSFTKAFCAMASAASRAFGAIWSSSSSLLYCSTSVQNERKDSLAADEVHENQGFPICVSLSLSRLEVLLESSTGRLPCSIVEENRLG